MSEENGTQEKENKPQVFSPPSWLDLKGWNTQTLATHAREVFRVIWERDIKKRNFYVKEIIRLYNDVGHPVADVPEDWKYGVVDDGVVQKPLEIGSKREEDDSQLPMVEVTVHPSEGFGPEAFFGVNGRRFRIQRGVRVRIPWILYNGPMKDAIQTTYTQDPNTMELIPHHSYRAGFGHTVHRIIQPGEK